MSETFDANEFGEVVRYCDGLRMEDRRELTGFEKQLLDELNDMTTNYSNASVEITNLEEKVQELQMEISKLSEVKITWAPKQFENLVECVITLFMKSKELKNLEEKKKETQIFIEQMRKEISLEKYEVRKEIDELKKQTEKFDGLKEMFHYLNNDYQYVILTDYYIGAQIKKLDECFCDNDRTELASVSFRVKNYHKKEKLGTFKMYIGQYSDDSGNKYFIIFYYTLNECEKWGIEDNRLKKFKTELTLKIERQKLEKKKRLEKDLQLLNEDLS